MDDKIANMHNICRDNNNNNQNSQVAIIGAGLAGCEAAFELARQGISVTLYDMKPTKMTPAHKSHKFGELVCSNSLGSCNISNASGLLKEELRRLGSEIIRIADSVRVPAGQALAVDREDFSQKITDFVTTSEVASKYINVVAREIKNLDEISEEYILIATGPLTSDSLSADIQNITGGEYLYFYDAAAPIVTRDSIDMNIAYEQSRYDKGDGEYINCPMTRDEYEAFYNELINAERAPLHHFEKEKLFDACQPIERIAMSGEKSMLFGPLKPKGLTNPHTGTRDHAVVQLRQDNHQGTLYNIVGFQTNLKWGEQKRVFTMIPGLANAEFVRYGVMHRNTYINSPGLLTNTLNLKTHNNIYFAGQITGSEGYVCAIATGLYAGRNIAHRILHKDPFVLPTTTMLGAMIHYITSPNDRFQPMGPNFGIMPELPLKIRQKQERYQAYAERALEALSDTLNKNISSH